MKSIIKVGVLGGMLAIATPMIGQINIGVGIRIGPPPPPREEVIVAQRPYPDAIWIEGYYRWAPRRHHYVWVRGHWERPPHRHAVWVAGRWEQRHGEWVYFQGRWENQRKAPAREERIRREGGGR